MTDDSLEPRASAGGEVDERAILESEILEALRQVVDPEIGIDVVSLGLIRQIVVDPGDTEIRMILTSPFCPYGGVLVHQIRSTAQAVVAGEVTVTLLDEPWSPEMMEGGDPSEWGLL